MLDGLLRRQVCRQGADQARLQGGRKPCQQRRDIARDLRRAAGRVEALRVGPDLQQALADSGLAQVLQVDAERLAVGELGVVLALQREVGKELDDVADVDADRKSTRLK